MSHFYWFVRDNISSKLYENYKIYMVWSFLSGALIAYISFYSLNGIIDERGITGDFWFMGLGMLYS